MRRTVAKKLRKEATKNHTYRQLKKEYKKMKSEVGEPKPKEEKLGGQQLGIVKRKMHSKNIYTVVDKNKFKKKSHA